MLKYGSGNVTLTALPAWFVHVLGRKRGRRGAQLGVRPRKGPKTWTEGRAAGGSATKRAENVDGGARSWGFGHEKGRKRGRNGQKPLPGHEKGRKRGRRGAAARVRPRKTPKTWTERAAAGVRPRKGPKTWTERGIDEVGENADGWY